MASRHGSSVPDRLATHAPIVGVLLGALYLAGALAAEGNVGRALLSRAGVALALVAGGFAVGAIGSRIASATGRVNDVSRQMSATAADHNAGTREILEHLGALTLAVKSRKAEQPAESTTAVNAVQAPAPAPAAAPAPAPVDPALYDRIVALLEEIREVSLMNDEQRQLRLQQHLEQRRKLTLDQVWLSFRIGQWAAADQMLTSLESHFPTDGPVKQARAEFHRQRAAAEADTFANTEQRVRDLCQVNSWDRAVATATEFVQNFPANVEGRHLLTQVHREFEHARDAAFQRLYDQVQANTDRRLWRAALADAQRLLEEFPTHSRANRIRQQLKTIHENAEIEQRQEHEVRIQLLVKNRRFAEAVELAEEVVRRFPDSPQADALEQRLPQLRELAEHGDGNGA